MILKKPRGGMWLDLQKSPADERPIAELKAPSKIYLPLRQFQGVLPVCCVSEGESVQVGKPVALAADGVSCSLHSPVSGIVAAITTYDHPLGGLSQMIVIQNDGRDMPFNSAKRAQPKGVEIIDAVRESAAVAASSYGPPLWAKLAALSGKKVKTIVINAVESEPFICSSQKIIEESPDRVAGGLTKIMECVRAKSAVLAISDDYPAEIVDGIVSSARLEGIMLKVAHIPQKYPLGMEKYLLQHIFKHEIEYSKLHDPSPEKLHAGFVSAEDCVNVYSAVNDGLPQISRVITVSGNAVENPQNLEVRIGTTVRDVLDHCGLAFDPDRVVLGSAMRGVAVSSLNTPITKSVTAVLALKALRGGMKKSICINCGKCVNVCPQGLLPNYIAMRAVKAEFDALRELHIKDCVECGLCAYVCPGRMPIVELIKNIKKAGL